MAGVAWNRQGDPAPTSGTLFLMPSTIRSVAQPHGG